LERAEADSIAATSTAGIHKREREQIFVRAGRCRGRSKHGTPQVGNRGCNRVGGGAAGGAASGDERLLLMLLLFIGRTALEAHG